MTRITTTGLDLAKNVFHVVCCDKRGKVIKKRMLKHREMLTFFATLTPCLISMESCASAHYRARQLEIPGHEVKLISAQYVKACVRGNKNDYNDALAISEAVTRPQMRFVSVKPRNNKMYRLCTDFVDAVCKCAQACAIRFGNWWVNTALYVLRVYRSYGVISHCGWKMRRMD